MKYEASFQVRARYGETLLEVKVEAQTATTAFEVARAAVDGTPSIAITDAAWDLENQPNTAGLVGE